MNATLDHKKLKRQKGFSLLEVLIAMAISALMYVGGYSILESVLSTNETVRAKNEKLIALQRAVHLMQRDIEQSISRPVRDQYGERIAAMKYGSASLDGLEFTRLGWKNPLHRRRSDLQRVAYVVDEEVLIRRYWLILDRDFNTEAKETNLLENIIEMKVRFYDLEKEEWRDDWPPDRAAVYRMPNAVEIKLDTKDFGEIRRLFRVISS